ncbi:MAG: hypothetical protein H6679_04410 [Epsilonproteobacteria bacterium]|nr:hypothetical protein [Campylobacterota bacterium]
MKKLMLFLVFLLPAGSLFAAEKSCPIPAQSSSPDSSLTDSGSSQESDSFACIDAISHRAQQDGASDKLANLLTIEGKIVELYLVELAAVMNKKNNGMDLDAATIDDLYDQFFDQREQLLRSFSPKLNQLLEEFQVTIEKQGYYSFNDILNFFRLQRQLAQAKVHYLQKVRITNTCLQTKPIPRNKLNMLEGLSALKSLANNIKKDTDILKMRYLNILCVNTEDECMGLEYLTPYLQILCANLPYKKAVTDLLSAANNFKRELKRQAEVWTTIDRNKIVAELFSGLSTLAGSYCKLYQTLTNNKPTNVFPLINLVSNKNILEMDSFFEKVKAISSDIKNSSDWMEKVLPSINKALNHLGVKRDMLETTSVPQKIDLLGKLIQAKNNNPKISSFKDLHNKLQTAKDVVINPVAQRTLELKHNLENAYSTSIAAAGLKELFEFTPFMVPHSGGKNSVPEAFMTCFMIQKVIDSFVKATGLESILEKANSSKLSKTTTEQEATPPENSTKKETAEIDTSENVTSKQDSDTDGNTIKKTQQKKRLNKRTRNSCPTAQHLIDLTRQLFNSSCAQQPNVENYVEFQDDDKVFSLYLNKSTNKLTTKLGRKHADQILRTTHDPALRREYRDDSQESHIRHVFPDGIDEYLDRATVLENFSQDDKEMGERLGIHLKNNQIVCILDGVLQYRSHYRNLDSTLNGGYVYIFDLKAKKCIHRFFHTYKDGSGRMRTS